MVSNIRAHSHGVYPDFRVAPLDLARIVTSRRRVRILPFIPTHASDNPTNLLVRERWIAYLCVKSKQSRLQSVYGDASTPKGTRSSRQTVVSLPFVERGWVTW